MRRLVGARAETGRERLARILIPGTTGGLYTLWPGTIGFAVVIVVYVHSYLTGKPAPGITGELLWACVGLMAVHTGRGMVADRYNAQAGFAPVPVDPNQPGVTPAAPGPTPDVQDPRQGGM